MVFFTCNSCGESLKKAQIDKHKGMCRGCTCLSCIDCGKDFWGEDYKSHVKCITEDQKYGGKGYEAKVQKGDVKQQQWIQRIQEALNKPGITPKLKDVLNQVSSYDNVPRKKAKFQNWMKNSLRIHDTRLHDQVWDIFSTADSNQLNGNQQPESKPDPPQPPQLQEQQEEKPSEKKKNKRERKEERQKKSKRKQAENGNAKQEQNGEVASDEQRKKKKKRERAAEECGEDGQNEGNKSTHKPKKRKGEEPEEDQSLEDEEDQQEVQDQSNTKGKFNWKGTIKAVLRQAPDEGLSIKKLRKKVLAAYYSFSGDANYKSEEQLFTLFNKKINNPKFKILKDKVRLVE
ncbi:cell growth-regulating nucleolar protein isoform X1 [Pygocentrus nattereri]|uniref:Cell growth-regulating nucleolar protein n=1 Tax=Pygocentrus nattereri TaxID=42514 RepID=A0A3B4DWE0_PYGNA|nr:cell growth-regulating nucleolar protein isoform X1 [Pygocentrus nattereri]